MKIFKRLILLFPVLIIPCFLVNSQSLKLAGLWRSNNGVLLHVSDSGSGIIARYILPDDCADGHRCPINGGGTYYVKGTKNGNTISLEMLRCTHKKAMRDEGMEDRWITPCKITTVNNNTIEGTWRTNWYWWDTDNTGREHNFRRDEKEDKDSPFSMNRTSCSEELSRIVAEINQKAELLKELEDALQDEDKRFNAAKETWKQEIDDQLAEEAYQTFVPTGVKISPGTDQDWGSYIESWVDFAKELGEVTKKWSLKTGAGVVSVADLIIDWTNINLKGVQTLNEMETIHHSLVNMRDNKLNLFSSWITSWMEYEKLKDWCVQEIPLNKQPKPDVKPVSEEPLLKSASESASMQKQVGSSIRTAKHASMDISKILKKMKSTLEAYQTADSTATIGQVMQAADINKLENMIKDLSNSLTSLFSAIKLIHEYSQAKHPRVI